MTIDATEQARRRALIEEHYAAENDHDLERIMDTFADDAVMQFNHLPLEDDEGIRGAHILIGKSDSPGALSGLRNMIDAEHYTNEETVVEGRMCGKHSKELLGFAPTEREVETFFKGIVDNPLYEARLHTLHQGGEIVFHEDHFLAVHDSHRQELVLGMDAADLKELAQWLGSHRD